MQLSLRFIIVIECYEFDNLVLDWLSFIQWVYDFCFFFFYLCCLSWCKLVIIIFFVGEKDRKGINR